MSKDYYKMLGVEKNASQDEIKKAFRKKAHEFHPDKQTGDEAKFKEVNEAYQVLGSQEKRSQYDQFGSTFDQQGGFGGGMNWDDFMNQARGGGFGGGVNVDFGDLGDIFGDIFGFGGGGRSGQRSKRGSDVQVDLTLEFKESIFGAEKELDIFKYNICDICNGNGAEPGTKINTCKTCSGQGQVSSVQRTFLGNIQTRTVCPDCQGKGQSFDKKCLKCNGEGRYRFNKKIKVHIPAGVDNGMTIKMSGEGEVASLGGRSGDLYIIIKVKPDKDFNRQHDNILTKVEIPYSLAVFGDKIDVKTIDGSVKLKIPSATQNNDVFRLRGKGVPRFQGSGRGDQLVEIVVAVPKKLDKNQKKIVDDLKQSGL